MNRFWLPWLLGGALAASLLWNVRSVDRAAAATPAAATHCTRASPCGEGGGSCSSAAAVLPALGLAPPQQEELGRLLAGCDAACARVDGEAARVAARLDELLRDPIADGEAVREQAQELGRLRAAAITDCVESALALRRVLTAEQLGRLLDACCAPGE